MTRKSGRKPPDLRTLAGSLAGCLLTAWTVCGQELPAEEVASPEPGRPVALDLPTPLQALDREAAASSAGGPDEAKPLTGWIIAASAGTVLGSAYNSFSDGPNRKFHFHDEGFFGQNTYAGGSDKANHFVSYNAIARLMTGLYQDLHMSPDNARLLGFAVSTFAGFVTEVGDGTTRYGFSYEDFVFDALGAATALATAHYGLDDLIGFRIGLVPYTPAPVCCPYGGFGYDYSQLISTADLKISGLAKRLHFQPGPARFLYFSVTYGTKGYPYDNPVVRERQIGFEIGLHITEIMRTLGVPEKPWWGQILYFIFDTIRFPYTAVGVQYDLNHGQWHGPGIGDSFPGGP